MKHLKKNSPVPLYYQLQEDLKRDIEGGIYSLGETIPNEKALGELYNVSRITVRKAVEGLVLEGLLVKKQGIGTVVSIKKINEVDLKLKGFTEKLADQGIKAGTKVLEVKEISMPSRIRRRLGVSEEEKCLFLKRLRYADDEPIGLFVSYIPMSVGVHADEDFSGSLLGLFEEKYHIKISKSDRIITSSLAFEEEAELLDIQKGDPVLIVKYITFDNNNNIVEYAEGVYRSDKYQYQFSYKR